MPRKRPGSCLGTTWGPRRRSCFLGSGQTVPGFGSWYERSVGSRWLLLMFLSAMVNHGQLSAAEGRPPACFPQTRRVQEHDVFTTCTHRRRPKAAEHPTHHPLKDEKKLCFDRLAVSGSAFAVGPSPPTRFRSVPLLNELAVHRDGRGARSDRVGFQEGRVPGGACDLGRVQREGSSESFSPQFIHL